MGVTLNFIPRPPQKWIGNESAEQPWVIHSGRLLEVMIDYWRLLETTRDRCTTADSHTHCSLMSVGRATLKEDKD